jgi:hypothetical protein
MFEEATKARQTVVVIAAAISLLAAGCGTDHKRSNMAGPSSTPSVATGRTVVRIPGNSPADVASAGLLAVYADPAHQPRGLVLTPEDDWRQAAVAAQFAADPLDGAVLPTAGAYLQAGPLDLVRRLTPTGFPRAQGLQALLLGRAGDDVLSPLQARGLHLTEIGAKDAAELALKLVPFRGGWAHVYSDEVVIASSQARDYALPAAAWSAYSGDSLAFVTRRSVPNSTRQLLVQRQKLRLQKPTMYVIGPPDAISDGVIRELRAYGSVKRVAGTTPVTTAIALARYKDPKTGFGWGLKHGPASVSVINRHRWGDVFGVIALAGAGPQAALLLTDNAASAPPEVIRYLRQLRTSGPSQAFVVGSEDAVAPAQFTELDRALSGAG